MYVNTKANLLDRFLDRTAGDTYSQNRLVTREAENGNVVLIAYGWVKIAEYDESRNVVTIFTGHKNLQSTTIARYLNDVARRAEDRGRDIVLSGESPYVDTPNEGVEYIGSYVSMDGDRSPVEEDAVSDVVDSLAGVA